MRSKYLICLLTLSSSLLLTSCYSTCNRMGPNDCYGDRDCWATSQACGRCNVCDISPALPNAAGRCCGDKYYISQ